MTNNTCIHSVSRDFVDILEGLSQYVRHQQSLGNRNLGVSQDTLKRMDNWTKSWKKESGFVCNGPESSDILLIDSRESFFTGEEGALLVKILSAMTLGKDDVCICNIPGLEPVEAWINQHSPKVIITLGERAGRLLLDRNDDVVKFRGQFYSFKGVQVMPTFHPSTLLVKPELKRMVWEDMKQVMSQAGLCQ